MTHIELIETAKEAIKAVFSDNSVSQDQTRDSLEELQEEIETMIDSLT